MTQLLFCAAIVCVLALAVGCASTPRASKPDAVWAIAIHGGAGVIDKSTPAEDRQAYERSLADALEIGRSMLASGRSALETVEAVVRTLEDNPRFNAGKGAVFTYEGGHELDASIMDGSTLACGSVAGVKTIKNPISLARLVMTSSPHVLLLNEGAERFASTQNVERVDNTYFDTPARREQWEKRKREIDEGRPIGGADFPGAPHSYGTVGAVAVDASGRLAAATSTGGMTCKRWGRAGDSPIIGAGTYADHLTAVSCTGTGEEFIRHGVARQIALIRELQGQSVQIAADRVVHGKLKPDDGGVIVVGADGSIAMVYNSDGMFRGAADARGRFEIGIWETMTPAKNTPTTGSN